MRATFRGITVKIPIVPISALLFYSLILVLWQVGILPSPAEIFEKLEELYESNGVIGLFIATILEGLVYLGLYFPGSSIILLSVILSDGSIVSLFGISLVVSIALTFTSIINYLLGRRLSVRPGKSVSQSVERTNARGLLLSALHPNALAFYFFHSGLLRRTPKEIIYVPIILIPYGLVLGIVFYLLRTPIQAAVEAPGKIIAVLVAWLVIDLAYQYRKAIKPTRP